MSANSHDVARLAGVSHITVSRYFQHPDKLSKDTREKIRNAAAELGYVPNSIASGLKYNKSTLVAMIVPSIKNSLFSATIQGVSEELRPRGFHLIVSDSGYDLEDEEQILVALLKQRPCGLILHSTQHTPRCTKLLQKCGIPIVEVGDLCADPVDSVVSYSNLDAAQTMTRYLIEQGKRRIGYVMLNAQNNSRVEARFEGYKRALAQARIAFDGSLVRAVDSGFSAGGAALASLMDQGSDLDAVFFSGDVHAIGAIMECQRRGWPVPGRIAIAGFDDHEIVDQIVPPLTTLAIPRSEIGHQAAQVILGRIGGAITGKLVKDLGFSLLIRGTA